jgi:hypothetical protein
VAAPVPARDEVPPWLEPTCETSVRPNHLLNNHEANQPSKSPANNHHQQQLSVDMFHPLA